MSSLGKSENLAAAIGIRTPRLPVLIFYSGPMIVFFFFWLQILCHLLNKIITENWFNFDAVDCINCIMSLINLVGIRITG